jgi:UrcA family protein
MNSNIKTRISLGFATAILLTCLGGAPGALADEPVRTETVKFQDLNVDTPDGARALYARIHAAAKRVCAESDAALKPAENACIGKAEGNAIDKLNLAQLTAYYQNKTKTKDHAQPLVAAR